MQDLDYLNQNYMSLTTNQNVGTYLSLNGTLFIKKALFTRKAIVQVSIKTDVYVTSFPLNGIKIKLIFFYSTATTKD